MFWKKRRASEDLEEEIESHLAHEADEAQSAGRSREDAESSAKRSFGNAFALREQLYERERWMPWENFTRDLQHAFRLCFRRPGFSLVVVLTLALGIGANTAIFSVINAVLLRPLPFRDADRLAMLWTENAAHHIEEGRVSLPNFQDWEARAKAFEGLTIFVGQTFLLGNSDGPPERMRSARVRSDFFPMLGVAPLAGRVFTSDEEKRGEPVVVLSHQLWQRRFGESPKAIGSDLIMDGRKSRIIGVMPADFQFPFPDTQVWEPVTAHRYWTSRDRTSVRSFSVWYVIGRLRDNVTGSQAQAEMNGIAQGLAERYPENRDLPEIRIVPLQEQSTGSVQRPLALLFGAVFLMLLIACINAANLLLARGASREREFAVRRALGAGRGRLVALLLTESLVLGLAAGAAGLALAAAALKLIVSFGPREIPRLAEAGLDWTVLLFTMGLSLFAALASGLWPALRASASVPKSREWTTVANRNVRNVLVVAEFAITLILLAGAGLMVRSLMLLQNVDPGFRPDHLLVMRVDLHVGRTGEQYVAYFANAIQKVTSLPGVQSAAAVTGFLRSDPEDTVWIEGRDGQQQPGPCDDLIIGPYLETAGVPLKRGRPFSDGVDRAGSPPVAIVNEAMVRTYWPAINPIGQRFRFRTNQPWITVVGVSGDMHRQGLAKSVVPQVFRPMAQQAEDMMDIIVRTNINADAVAATVRNEIQSIDASVAKFNVATIEEQFLAQTAPRRFQTALFSLFSLAALIMSAVGVFGLMHYFVVQRTGEIGLRMALGARFSDVILLVLKQGLMLAAAGIAIGISAALLLMRLLSSLLFGVTATDPLTFTLTAALLLAVAVIACWIPGKRASRIDPLDALRQS